MKYGVTASSIVGKKITRIVKKREGRSDSFVHYQQYVELEEKNWIAIDSRGVDDEVELCWTPSEDFLDKNCESVFDELVGLTVRHVVLSDYLPTFALVLSNGELLYSADLGPPFNAFGPLHERLGSFYKEGEMLDFWKRKPIERFETDEPK
ncbi:MAG: hypothetical protein LW870_21525 [Pirellula sp.]|jgi:hypothetical protein|nr:hypothetical protein [Pirellula sp.]